MTCLDPFGGTGLGGMDAGLAGIQWIGIELEPRFCDLAHGFDCDGTVQEALLGTFTPALPASHEWFLTDGVDRWGPEGRGEPFARGFLTNTEADGWRDAHPEAFVTDVTLEEVTIPAIPAYVTFTWEVVTPARCGEKQAHEPHHVLGNLELWQRKYGHLPQWVAPICLQGDSRRLGEVLQEPCACVVASPPYVEGLGHHRGTEADKKEWQYKSIGSNDYGHTEGQLANLPPGSLDAAISSPPYATGLGKEHTYADHAKRERDSHRRIMTEKGITDPYYGSDPAQLGNMATGEIDAALAQPPDCAISSPPYADGCTHTGGTDPHPQHVQGGPVHHVAYGHEEGQLGAMAAGEIDAVVTSPPFAACTHVNTDPHDMTAGKAVWGDGNNSAARVKQDYLAYSDSPAQLGNTEATTFWSAALQILTQTYAVLKPGGHAIFVVKSYCRDGKIVDFPGQWRALCEHVGFVTLHEHHAMLVETHTEMGLFGEPVVMARTARKSFFRRLYENAHPENAIDFEVVLCMQKAPSPTPLPPDGACCQLPLIDGCVCSPPYADRCSNDNQRTLARDGLRQGHNEGDGATYGMASGNLGNMSTGTFDLALSSPPYAETTVAACEGNISGKPGGRKASALTTVSGNIKKEGYGPTSGQLGKMPAGSIDAVVASPPWLNQEPSHAQADTPSAQRLRDEPASVRGQSFLAATYGTTAGQLGTMPAGTPPTVEGVSHV